MAGWLDVVMWGWKSEPQETQGSCKKAPLATTKHGIILVLFKQKVLVNKHKECFLVLELNIFSFGDLVEVSMSGWVRYALLLLLARLLFSIWFGLPSLFYRSTHDASCSLNGKERR